MPRSESRAPRWAIAAVVAGLLLSAQERSFGLVTDEQQAIGTAVALVERGDLGLPRGFAFAVPRPEGDALSPYGLGMPVALAPAVALAPRWERAFGAGSSQSLLILVPLACVALAAAASGLVARGLGAGPAGQAAAILATGLSSPLWPLGSTAFSEPLQAALLGGCCAAALASARALREGALRRARGLSFLAGALASGAVLTKSVNLAVAPACLLPLLMGLPIGGPGSASAGAGSPLVRALVRALAPAALGAAPGLVAWLAAEIARFGRPLASYEGQGFTHPPLDGLWRLLISPNEGLLPHFPIILLAVPAAAAAWRLGLRPAVLGVLAPCAILLGLVSAWWAWDGSAGWGPRLLAPLVPLLAGLAGVAVTSSRRLMAAAALLVAGSLVNVLGLLQPQPGVQLYVDSTGPAEIPERERAWWPREIAASSGGRNTTRSLLGARDPAFAPIRVHAAVLAVRAIEPDPPSRMRRLEDRPPWRSAHPGLRPELRGRPGEISGVLVQTLVSDPAWPHWLACTAADDSVRRALFGRAWLDALDDQVLRHLARGEPEIAGPLAQRSFDIARHDRSAMALAECLRAAGRLADCERFLVGLPQRTLNTPEGLAVRALLARDRGTEAEARDLLARLAEARWDPRLSRLAQEPLAEWPPHFVPLLDPSAAWGSNGRP